MLSTYLTWLNNRPSAINILAKRDGKVIGNTLATVDAADQYILGLSDCSSIWCSVHSVKATAAGKIKLSKSDIDAYRYLCLDIDNRYAHSHNVSATDAERAITYAKAIKVADYLAAYGLPRPLLIMSGNGHLLLFPIDLPYTADNYTLLATFADTLADKYSDEQCDIDTAVAKDPSRILGVVGTVNRNRLEVPEDGRYAQERTIVGDYPSNTPMAAMEFVAAA